MTMTLERPAEAVESFAALSAAVHPAWHQAILRLASATERVAKQFEIWNDAKWSGEDGAFVREARRLADDLIRFLDEIDVDEGNDPDLEPSLGTGMFGGDDREGDDCEMEDDDPAEDADPGEDSDPAEPWLGWTADEAARGTYAVSDLEGPEAA